MKQEKSGLWGSNHARVLLATLVISSQFHGTIFYAHQKYTIILVKIINSTALFHRTFQEIFSHMYHSVLEWALLYGASWVLWYDLLNKVGREYLAVAVAAVWLCLWHCWDQRAPVTTLSSEPYARYIHRSIKKKKKFKWRQWTFGCVY